MKTNSIKIHHVPARPVQGFTMLEAIVAVIITSVGLLGVAALQGTAISHTKTASDRSVAASQLSNLISRMKTSQGYWQSVSEDFDITIAADGTIADAGSGVEGAALEAQTIDCSAASCGTAESIVAYSLRTWAADGGVVDTTSGFADRLNNVTAAISRVDTSLPIMLDVSLSWNQKNTRTGFAMGSGFAAISTANYRIRVQP